MSDLEDFEDFIEYTRRVKLVKQGLRRYLRDYDDPFTKHSPEDFFSRYRFTPHVVKNALVPMIEPDLKKPTKRGLPFSPEIMMLITLRFYATGSFKRKLTKQLELKSKMMKELQAKTRYLKKKVNDLQDILNNLSEKSLGKHVEAKQSIKNDFTSERTLKKYTLEKFEQDTMEVCQQSASRIIAKISILLAQKMRNVVKFPSKPEGIHLVKKKFYEIAKFPDVVGCVACTHIKIKSPGGNSAVQFKNKKGWFSINVQAVAGPDLQFYNLVARWPGSTDHNFIFNRSLLKQTFENGELEGVLLGDNSYKGSSVLMTPLLSPSNPGEERYNKSLIKTRRKVEQALEVWKRRFPCLQTGMALKLDTVKAVICACAALHNIAIRSDNILESHLDHDSNEEDEDETEDSSSSGTVVPKNEMDI